MKNLYCGNNLYFCARNNSKGMKEKLKGHSAMFTANFLWGIMSPISKAIFLTGTISAFSLTNMRMGLRELRRQLSHRKHPPEKRGNL